MTRDKKNNSKSKARSAKPARRAAAANVPTEILEAQIREALTSAFESETASQSHAVPPQRTLGDRPVTQASKRPGDLIARAEHIRETAEVNDLVRNPDPLSNFDRQRANRLEAQALAVPNSAVTERGVGGEVIPIDRYGPGREIRDTLDRPTMVNVVASRDRTQLAHEARVLELSADLQETIGAQNAIERMLASQMAVLHVTSMKFGKRLHDIGNWLGQEIPSNRPVQDHLTVEVTRLTNAMARASGEFQNAALTIQKLRSGGRQAITVTHIDQRVSVEDGGQAVIAGVGAIPRVGGQNDR